MKTLIRSILLLAAIAVFSFGCEGRNFAETQKLHKSHGSHDGEHAEGHDAEKGELPHKSDEKDAGHSEKKKDH